MNKKFIIAAMVSLVVCISLIAGYTFALFTSETKANIAVTSGKVEVVATIDETTIETKQLYKDYQVGKDHLSPDATVMIKGGDITFDKIIPGDGVKFDIKVTNNSNIAVKYRTVISAVDGGSLNGLVITIGGKQYNGNEVVDNWLLIGAGDPIFNIPVTIEFPEANNNDLYQAVATKLSITVEVVQGNAQVQDAPDAPEQVAPGTLDELKEAFAAAVNQSTGDLTITLTKDFDAANGWVAVDPKGYSGSNNIIIEGNGHSISNLNEPLMVGAFGGAGSVTIKNLTLVDVNITGTQKNGMGLGAFLGYSDSSATVVLENCHIKATEGKTSTITCTDGYAGGLIGYISSATTIKDCSVNDTVISGQKSVAALVGHVGANLTVEDTKVVDCTVNETVTSEQRAWGAAAVAGRITAGDVVLENVTFEGTNTYNVANPNTEKTNDYYGTNVNGSKVTLDGNNI